MRIFRRAWAGLGILMMAALTAPQARAAGRGHDPLALVPAEATSVAVVHLDQLRASPFVSRLFSDADKVASDGDAARFLAEANLSLKHDVDTVVFAALPASAGGDTPVLAIFEGRFDRERLAAAAEARGAIRKSSLGGDYDLLPDKRSGENSRSGAVAFVSDHLVIAGTESAVIDTLAARRNGATGLSSGAGLGRHLGRVSRGAAVWALVDVSRSPALPKRSMRGDAEGKGEPAAALVSAMKSVTLFAVEASPRGDALELAASGLSPDAETRQLLEDSLRGLLAMWRLAVEEKQLELVSALRKFQVGNDGESVTIRGSLPGSVLRSLSRKERL